MSVSEDELRHIVHAVLDEEKAKRTEISEDVVLKAIATILTSFGIEEDDRVELRRDFEHLRRWRKSVEQAQTYTFKALITIIVSGFVGAVWLGFKAAIKP